jgi:beta-mannanase
MRRSSRASLAFVTMVVLGVTVLLMLEAPSRATSTGRWWGVAMAGVPTSMLPLSTLSSEVGRSPGVVMWYVAWPNESTFPTQDAAAVAATGATPEITWEPWDPAGGVNQPAYRLSRITSGNYDSYIETWATAIKAWGGQLRLRFAHEMNGNWYPWSQGVNGNGAGSYVAAWRHIRAIFSKLGVTNVTWIWSPNAPFPGTVPLSSVFPGDAYVDEVALDGYNWSNLKPTTTWLSFAQVFGPGVTQLQSLSARPITIGETGCPEVGGNKAQWITDMWTSLAHWTQVKGLVWFDINKETDWRIDSSASSLAAFKAGLPGWAG